MQEERKQLPKERKLKSQLKQSNVAHKDTIDDLLEKLYFGQNPTSEAYEAKPLGSD